MALPTTARGTCRWLRKPREYAGPKSAAVGAVCGGGRGGSDWPRRGDRGHRSGRATRPSGITWGDGSDRCNRSAGAAGGQLHGQLSVRGELWLDDAVSWQGSTYISLIAGNLGNTPSLSPAQWALLAAQGATGATGAAGPAGRCGRGWREWLDRAGGAARATDHFPWRVADRRLLRSGRCGRLRRVQATLRSPPTWAASRI